MNEDVDLKETFTEEEIDELLAWLATITISEVKILKDIWESMDNTSGSVQ